ncbi:MAG: efflux RND transporter permease subunit [Nitrosomonas sp.]|nr:MAG: efflux RND transporter permease subunit [Nitrosomonas sp.]
MKLIIWFARNPIAANLLMLLIIAGGFFGLSIVKRYTMPPAPQNQLQIEIAYPGASPAEVERALCIPIEEAVHDLEGLRHINTVANQAECEITLEFDPKMDLARFQAGVQARMDRITTFPQSAEKWRIRELKAETAAVIVTVQGDVDQRTLMQQRDRLQAMMSKHPDIGLLIPWPRLPYEVSIEVPPAQLHRYALSFDEIAEAVRAASNNIPAGELKKHDGKLLLRGKNQAMTVDDFAAIKLRLEPDGAYLLLGDIADIRETVNERDLRIRIDGKTAMQMYVMPKDRITTTVDAVNAVIAEFRLRMPDGIDVSTWDDWSKYYRQNMSMLTDSAISGFCLIFLILALTLRFHLAFWVGSGILVSILGTFWAMPILGISLNTYSIAALILVLGIVVDDAIVIGENIFSHEQRGHTGLSGVIRGTLEVAPLVVTMVLSTMIAFVPGLFISGLSGYLMYNVSAVIILTLAFSLMESLLILPAHLAAHQYSQTSHASNRIAIVFERLRMYVDRGLHRLIDGVYVPVLKRLLRLRYITLTVFGIALLLTGALVFSGRVQSVMDAPVNDYYLFAFLQMEPGTPFAELDRQVGRLEHIANEMRHELNAELGISGGAKLPDSFQHIIAVSDDHNGFVDIEIAIDERVRARMDRIKQQWQERFGELPPGTTLSFQTFWPRNLGVTSAVQSAKAIELKLTAPDSMLQSEAGEILKTKLASYAGVHSVTGTMQAGKPELHLKLKPEAENYGLTLQSLGEQVRNGFLGLEVQRYFFDRDEVRVIVRFPPTDRRSLDDLYRMPIQLDHGDFVPFAVVAEAAYTPGFASITRQDRERIQLISAEVYKEQASVETIVTDLRNHLIPELEQQFPGLKIEPGQRRQKQEQAMSDLWAYGVLALLGIYALLAVPLRSYTQPLLIMLSIPFGFIGAVLGHMLLNIPLSLESYVALFAVGGIVINDGLILVARINKFPSTGKLAFRAIVTAGKMRFRAIFLTTTTTFAGLLPLLNAQSSDAEKIMPMAASLAFGILFSSLVTLLLIPVSFMVLKEVGRTKTHVG